MRQFGELIRATREVALRHPLNKNPDFSYFDVDGQPCCIFGHAFARLGLFRPGFPTNIVSHLPWNELGFDDPQPWQQDWVASVQVDADSGHVWASAVASADAEHLLPV